MLVLIARRSPDADPLRVDPYKHFNAARGFYVRAIYLLSARARARARGRGNRFYTRSATDFSYNVIAPKYLQWTYISLLPMCIYVYIVCIYIYRFDGRVEVWLEENRMRAIKAYWQLPLSTVFFFFSFPSSRGVARSRETLVYLR